MYDGVPKRSSAPAVVTALLSRNRLLSRLPPRDRARLATLLEPLDPELRQVLFEAEEPIRHFFFPISGVFSIVVRTRDRIIIEVATIGFEGVLGTPRLLGIDHYDATVLCQVPGSLLRIEAAPFLRLVDESPFLRALLHRYLQAFHNFVARNAVCNRAHPIEQRCARWLLLTHDRVEQDDFLLTQEFLAQMLGVRRASVSIVASMLQQARLISYSRGYIHIVDRKGLERMACDCYSFIQRNYERLVMQKSAGRAP